MHIIYKYSNSFVISFFLSYSLAPPAFVKRLPERGGVRRNTTNVQLSCHVECHPLCELEWLRNNESLRDSIVFESKTAVHRPEPKRNLFSSISSVLTWNMSLLPVNSFDYATFTCRSSGNEIGAGVSSTMAFRVECKYSTVLCIFLLNKNSLEHGMYAKYTI